MSIILPSLTLIIGFVFLLAGAYWVVQAAVSIATRRNISPFLIGATIVAAGTSLPELLTTLSAALDGNSNIAMGNIIGSNIFNLLVIGGFASLISPLIKNNRITRFELPLLIVFTLTLMLFSLNYVISFFEGLLCIALFIGYLVFSIKMDFHTTAEAKEAEDQKLLKNKKAELFYLIVGISGLIGGAKLALQGAITLGEIAGLSQRVIGLTIISAGTGLPELATSFVAALKKQNELAISNIIGSNIMNTLAVAGITALFQPIHVEAKIVSFDQPFLLAGTILIFLTLFINKKINTRLIGSGLLLTYAFYLYQLI